MRRAQSIDGLVWTAARVTAPLLTTAAGWPAAKGRIMNVARCASAVQVLPTVLPVVAADCKLPVDAEAERPARPEGVRRSNVWPKLAFAVATGS